MKTDFEPALGLIKHCRERDRSNKQETDELCDYLEKAINELNDWKMRFDLAPIVHRTQVYGPSTWIWSSGREGLDPTADFSHTARLMDIKEKDVE